MIILLFAMFFGVSSAQATNLDDERALRTAHSALLSAVEHGNLVVLKSVIHPFAIGFFQKSIFPVQLGPDYRVEDATPSVVSELSRFVGVPYEMAVRVMGTTGVVCATRSDQPRDKYNDSPRHLRSTYIYSKLGENWRLVSWHTSDMPLSSK